MGMKKSSKPRPLSTALVYLLAFTALFVTGCTSLTTPEIKGVVVDAETGKPIEGARVYAAWLKITAGPGGKGPGTVVKELWLTADAIGQFRIPEYRISNPAPYPFGQGGHWSLNVYAHEYYHQSYGFDSAKELDRAKYAQFKNQNDSGQVVFGLRKIDGADSFAKNYSAIYDWADKANEFDYRLADIEIFIDRYQSDKRVPDYMFSMGFAYEETGNIEKALSKYDSLLKKYPHSRQATLARERIDKLKRLKGKE